MATTWGEQSRRTIGIAPSAAGLLAMTVASAARIRRRDWRILASNLKVEGGDKLMLLCNE